MAAPDWLKVGVRLRYKNTPDLIGKVVHAAPGEVFTIYWEQPSGGTWTTEWSLVGQNSVDTDWEMVIDPIEELLNVIDNPL